MKFILVFLFSIFYIHQQKETMTVLISSNNHFFFYQNNLAKNGSNLKAGSYLVITDWSEYLKNQHGAGNVFFIIKLQRNDSLRIISKKLVDYFKAQKHAEFSSPTKQEEKMIGINEKAIAGKEE